MFIDFFFALRQAKIKVSVTEWLTLLEALKRGYAAESLMGFYVVTRALCVKSETLYDAYDQCFAQYFRGCELASEIKDDFWDWLKTAKLPDWDELKRRPRQDWDFDKIREEFEKRLKEQKERHDGGNHWIGTGGSSPFGHSGYHPGGIRVGGETGSKSAAQVASQRRFQDLRNDQVLDSRTISLALKRLRNLGRRGIADELDLDATIAATAKNAGDLELILTPPRKNTVKLLLLMDVGGSMTPYTQLCEKIFTAAFHAQHFKAFKHYYFHNCPYEYLFASMQNHRLERTRDVFKQLDDSWNLIVIGDAAMHPYELTEVGGSADYFHYNEDSGLQWLKRLRSHFPKSVWLNPEQERHWRIHSTVLIREVFSDMFPLTVGGLEAAIKTLNRKTQQGLRRH